MAIDEHDGAGASITRDLPPRLVPGPSDELGATTPGARGLAFADEMPARAGQIGRFIVLRRIGAGGMGVVYLAYDNALDRRVAVKLIRSLSAPDPETTARMRREAQGMARLSHPNVLQIYETGESDGSLFLAMEYVRGGSLAAWLARRSEAQQADWRASVAIFVQAGRGLAAAHQAGLVHRDFKPKSDCPLQTAPLPPSGPILANRGDLRRAVCRVMPHHAAVLATDWQRTARCRTLLWGERSRCAT
jgi:hypothetical protein